MIGVLAALAAAAAWTSASSLWRSLSPLAPAMTLNCIKNGLGTLLFLPLLVTLNWGNSWTAVGLLLLSGIVGIGAGDSFYLAALRRLGTRRTLTVEAIGPVLATAGSVVMLGQPVGVLPWLGAGLVSAAVVLVAWPKATAEPGSLLGVGLVCAVMAVLCGLFGAFVARQVLLNGEITPLQSAAVRLLGGWCSLLPFTGFVGQRLTHQRPGMAWRALIATVIGTNLGIALQQLVFQQLPVGEGVTLMSTAPVMALLVSRFEGETLQWRGVLAAGLAFIGVACISL